MNAKIAEIIKWEPEYHKCDNHECEYCSLGAGHADESPNFCESLDACALFEKQFDEGDITDPDHPRYKYSHILYAIVPPNVQPFRAPPIYRAEAFLMLQGVIKKP